MIRWPDRQQVDEAARTWALALGAAHQNLKRVGYFGSYARGTWGVGSDLDLVLVVRDEPAPPSFERRGAAWDVSRLPVPAELLVYTESEWQAVLARGHRFSRMLAHEVIWIYEAGAA